MTYSLPKHLTTQEIPNIPQDLIQKIAPFLENKRATFASWTFEEGILLLKRSEKTRQIYIMPHSESTLAPLTSENEPVESVIPKSKTILFFTTCEKGNEKYRIYELDLFTGQVIPFSEAGKRCLNPLWSPSAEALVYASPFKNQNCLFIQKIKGSPAKRLTSDSNWWPMDWSPNGKQILAQKIVSNTESYPYLINLDTKACEPLLSTEHKMLCYQAKWARHGKGIFHISILNSEHLRLIYTEIHNHQHRYLTEDLYDVEHFSLSACGTYIAYTLNKEAVSELNFLCLTNMQPIQSPQLPVAKIISLNFHPSAPILAIELASPEVLLAWNMKSCEMQTWSGNLKPQNSTQKQIQFKSFDQRLIPAFYFPPPNKTQTDKNRKKSPVIVLIHGGPTAQSRPVLSPLFKYWQKEFNAAILLPNVRGSNGYGKKYMALDDGRLREDAVKDMGSLLHWIAEQKELDTHRVCLYGGSYGGYMVLASLVHYSEKIACGINLMGISNFVTFLENTSTYRIAGKRIEYGDERDPSMRKFLTQISPLANAHKIKSPLMVVHGKNDPRVPASEAEQMVKALQKNNTEVWYALFENEGHGLSKKDNADYFAYAATLFLQKHL